MQVDVGGFYLLVTEPQCNRGPIDTVSQKLHRRCVSECVRRDPFITQSGAFIPCDSQVLFEQIIKAVMGKWAPALVEKTGSLGSPAHSWNHCLSAVSESFRKGMHRVLRPFPKHRT